MLNFDFKRSSRKCCVSDREFQPGEEFYSALIECDDGLSERKDFCADEWKGPSPECIGWWKSKVPELNKGRVYWAPRRVLLAYFEHVLKRKVMDTAFVVGLLLAQKKILTIEDLGDESVLSLKHKTEKTTYDVPVVEITPARLGEIQNELSERLFMDQPVDPDSDETPDFGGEDE